MQLYTSINVFSKGKEAGKHDGFLCCTVGLGEGSKKPQTCLYWRKRFVISLLHTTHHVVLTAGKLRRY